MVATHLPSSIFLALLPVPPSLALTICLLVGRSVLNSMDQAPRSAFISLVVLPEERTAVMGVVNILKILSQSCGPSVTGILAGHGHFWVAFVAAGSIKAAYDLGLLALFAGRVHERTHGSEDPVDERNADAAPDVSVTETSSTVESDTSASKDTASVKIASSSLSSDCDGAVANPSPSAASGSAEQNNVSSR
jgi:sugar phosphate permease